MFGYMYAMLQCVDDVKWTALELAQKVNFHYTNQTGFSLNKNLIELSILPTPLLMHLSTNSDAEEF